ncbi:C45 family peptidase [Mesorhizobium sp. M4B.F.Ca.ET.049.02.1.2]|uniref:C45 family autoproteolytic acyltransferase/hydolase n=1 Tax=Mesorhizobium sp. M4B.F.Ca.ET.049.02.1.2 TaxID=2496752 RepID=UPI000FCBD895|nr:C45 family peptidase [Mesorhizobium sp. M4B.F.Ca.ET.049.02.1.2]RUW64876.1 peptidase C45 [Mesorhizobium sp. M4B.F.Ca.ET.049.02.1.2]
MSRNPISRVRAKGDAFSIGFTLGRATAPGFRQRVLGTEEFQALYARWRGSEYLRALESAARAAYPHIVREIEGIAEGAGQDFETVFLWNCRGDLRLPEHVSSVTKAVAAAGCTTLLIPAVGDAPAIIAHNEDGAAGFLGGCMWVEVEPDEGLAWSSFMYPGMLPGHTFGLNEAGVVQTVNHISAQDFQPGVPRQVICRAILNAESLDEAVDILKRKDRASGFHHNLGEAKTRRLASVEAPASGCAVREVASPRAHANHLLFEEFDGLEQTITLSSRNRQDAADRMIAKGALVMGAEAVLFDKTTPIFCDNNRQDDTVQTLATSVFALFPDRIEWRVHATPAELDALSGTIRVV